MTSSQRSVQVNSGGLDSYREEREEREERGAGYYGPAQLNSGLYT